MKKSLFIAVLAILPLSTTTAWAADVHHANTDSKSAVAMTDKDKQLHTAKMQDNMLRMHEQMHKITESKTPADRELHMQEHARIMSDNMSMMHGMMGCDGKSGAMDGGMKMDGEMKKGY